MRICGKNCKLTVINFERRENLFNAGLLSKYGSLLFSIKSIRMLSTYIIRIWKRSSISWIHQMRICGKNCNLAMINFERRDNWFNAALLFNYNSLSFSVKSIRMLSTYIIRIWKRSSISICGRNYKLVVTNFERSEDWFNAGLLSSYNSLSFSRGVKSIRMLLTYIIGI